MNDETPMNDEAPAAQRVRLRKPRATSNPAACPPGDPMRGAKTPAVIRWNAEHRRDEMDAIYGEWDWRGYLAEQDAD